MSRRIYIADDQPDVRTTLKVGLTKRGFMAECFPDGEALLAAVAKLKPDCVLLDVRMPGLNGIEIVRRLIAASLKAPIFMMSGVADVPMAVAAMKAGSSDFFQKPLRMSEIAASIDAAIDEYVARRGANVNVRDLSFPGKDKLTARELDVLNELASGASSKAIGIRLQTSPRTIEVHRSNILRKLGAKNSIELFSYILKVR